MKILITGCTGTIGSSYLKHIIQNKSVDKIVAVSRNELKQQEFKAYLENNFSEIETKKVDFVPLSISNYAELCKAMIGVDCVLHTAANKYIDLCAENIDCCIESNIVGTQNVINACIFNNVKKCILISTDKAVNPNTVYGASKFLCEKLFISANKFGVTQFSVLRGGNFMGSDGSILPKFIAMAKSGIKEFPITDARMQRYWLTVQDAMRYIDLIFEKMAGGEVLVPQMPKFFLVDLVKALDENNKIKIIGLRGDEKLEESLLNSYAMVYEGKDYYIEVPKNYNQDSELIGTAQLLNDFKFLNNPKILTVQEIKEKIAVFL